MAFDIVGMGGGVVDCLLRVEGVFFPSRRGDTPVEERPIVEWRIQGGGVVPSAMAAVGRLGARAAIIGTVGDDEWGRFLIADYEKHGVDTRYITIDESYTSGVTFILVGEKGSNRWVPTDMIRDWNLPEDIRRAVTWRDLHPRSPLGARRRPTYPMEQLEAMVDAKILNVGGFADRASLDAARIAKRKGMRICYDLYSHPGNEELIKYVTSCIPSRDAGVRLTGETDPTAICRKILSYGPEVAGITLGEEGVVLATSEETVVRKAFKVQAVDTTGAGDVFHGAFSFAMLQGWGVARAAEFSCAVSAMKCTKLGGRAGIPTLPEVEAFLKERVEEIR
jgi:sugar/nucleoside kinase (ribokinase family)